MYLSSAASGKIKVAEWRRIVHQRLDKLLVCEGGLKPFLDRLRNAGDGEELTGHRW